MTRLTTVDRTDPRSAIPREPEYFTELREAVRQRLAARGVDLEDRRKRSVAGKRRRCR